MNQKKNQEEKRLRYLIGLKYFLCTVTKNNYVTSLLELLAATILLYFSAANFKPHVIYLQF
jgi:hypothetical protein